jgi:hypothetical protein
MCRHRLVSAQNGIRLSNGNMDDRNNHHVGRCVTSTCGNFSVGDIKYYDGTSASQPSKAVKDLLRSVSVTVKPYCNSDSVFPYTASDVGVARDKDLVAFEMDMLAFLSGCMLVKVVDGAIVNYMCSTCARREVAISPSSLALRGRTTQEKC